MLSFFSFAFYGAQRLTEHGHANNFLLGDLSSDGGGQLPGAVLGCFGEHRHAVGIPLVIGHLRLLEQDVTLHGGVVGSLSPLHWPVVPVGGPGRIFKIAVQPAGKLGSVGTERQQLPALLGYSITDMMSDGLNDTEYYRQGSGRPEGAVISLAASTYHYDADNNLTYATTSQESGPDQSPIEIYADYTPYGQLAGTHYRQTSTDTFTGTAYTYDHDGDVTERDDNAQQTQASVTRNGQGVPVSWTFTQTGPPDVNTMTYDPADWLKTQFDQGTTSSCTGDKRIDTTWTPDGQEATSTINIAGSSCTYAPSRPPPGPTSTTACCTPRPPRLPKTAPRPRWKRTPWTTRQAAST